ncbi:PilZ domain-containing protein [Sphingomonas abietis]|uniref:PilZ domain-containing protein n=1 Tax=Sphingomonas abietis TaxID=3012344 RepID=A0ABY7NNQ6_9SPHN|nr:PilZ domain-containing protein [Sphingomonas abietis]WBO22455.1 PilZ domain-containing protein [Sphingomonas abietis]
MDNNTSSQSPVRQAEPRFATDLAARLVVVEGEPLAVRLINLSRNGFRVASPLILPAGQPVRLEVDGWPRLAGRVMWCDSGRIGCMVDHPPSEAVYAMMCAATEGRER